MIAKEIFLTRGVGKHKEKLPSFESALRNAGIAAFNLVRVSSIFPPHCRLISRKQGLTKLKPGQIVFAVISENTTNEPNCLITAAVGIAIPKDRRQYGYLSEHHSHGKREQAARNYSEDLAAEMLAISLGVNFDPHQSWDEKREIWRISGQIIQTRNIIQTAIGDKRGNWTTAIAAAVMITD